MLTPVLGACVLIASPTNVMSVIVIGGVAEHTGDVVRLCEAGAFDVIIVETVGLGQVRTPSPRLGCRAGHSYGNPLLTSLVLCLAQSELELETIVDLFVLLLPPAGGDELQGVKKGIMEVRGGLCDLSACSWRLLMPCDWPRAGSRHGGCKQG